MLAAEPLSSQTIESLEAENNSLHLKVAALQHDRQALQEQLQSQQSRIAWLERYLFGQRSERLVKALDERQLLLFELDQQPQQTETAEVAAHKRKKPVRDGKNEITYPDNLPVERIEIDLLEKEKICPETGMPLVRIGEEISRKLALRPGTYFVKEIIRPKYAHPAREENGVKVAELPDAILPRCRVDESFLAQLLVQKYVDHLPLYRISEIHERGGVQVSRQLLSQWVLGLGAALTPLYEEMHRHVLESSSVFADESPVALLAPVKTHTAYMWVTVGGQGANPPYRTYHFSIDRRHCHGEKILKGYSGILHSDKFALYEKLSKRDDVTWCPCWAHIRRKFFEAQTGPKELRDWVLAEIGKLYALESEAWQLAPEERTKLRWEKEAPIIDGLIERIKKELISGKVLPKSAFAKAIGYFVGLIPHMKTYLSHPFAHIDNNVAERAIRPLALGRKNWLFMGSERGGHAAAVALTLVQSCRALSIDPYLYLEDVLRRLPGHSNQRLWELLPDQWALARAGP